MGAGSSGSLSRAHASGIIRSPHCRHSVEIQGLRLAATSSRCPLWSFPTSAALPSFQPHRAVSSMAMVPSSSDASGPQASGSSSPTVYNLPPPLNRITPPNSGMTSREKPAAWRSMAATLASTPQSHHVPPERFIAGLNEVAAAAADKRQFPEMLQDQHFVSFLQRLAARLFGFSSYESYLTLASLLRIPCLGSTQIGSQLLARAIQQLAEEADDLGSVQFGHTSLLLGQAITQLRSSAPRPQPKYNRGRAKKGRPSAIQVSLEASEVERSLAIYEAEYLPLLQERASQLSGKGLALALQGLVEARAAVPKDCLLSLMSAARTRLPEVSPTRQLPALLFDLTQLGGADLEFQGLDFENEATTAAAVASSSSSADVVVAAKSSSGDNGAAAAPLRAQSVLLSGLELAANSAHDQLPRPLAQCLQVASFIEAAGCSGAAVETLLQPLLRRASIVTSFAGASDAIHLLRALCLLGRYDDQTFLKLLKAAASVPRTSLTAAEDDALHQVALSLLHDPEAAGILAKVQRRQQQQQQQQHQDEEEDQREYNDVSSSGDLWEQLFQPEDVVGDRAARSSNSRTRTNRRGGGADGQKHLISKLTKLLQSSVSGASILQRFSVADGFYIVPLMITMDSSSPSASSCSSSSSSSSSSEPHIGLEGVRLAVDLNLHSPTWQRSPTSAYEGLKQRHLKLLLGNTVWFPAGITSKDIGEAQYQDELDAAANRIASLLRLRLDFANRSQLHK